MRAKRTFALKVVDSDLFLSLPRSARLLYYDLGMRADDRGFILSPRRLLRSIDAPEKDLKVLLKAGYVYQFPSGVVVIMDWPVHNSVRRDRFVENWRNWNGNWEGGIMWCNLDTICRQAQLR